LDELEPIITVRYPGERFDPEVSRQAQAWMAYPDTSPRIRERDTGFAPVKVRVRVPHEPMPDESWKQDAACRGFPTEWWYPSERGSTARRGKEICARCTVRQPCEEAGRFEWWGIWGGFNREQRESRARRLTALRDAVKAAGCGSERGYQKHRHAGTPACAECLAAHAAHRRHKYRSRWAS
jgi:hypothetical protein